MVKSKHPKRHNMDTTEIPTIKSIENIEPEIIHTPIGSATIDITPGRKVKIIGKDEEFVISQKLNNGKISILGPNGLILQVEPDELRNI